MVMENLLRSKEYWIVVESGYNRLTSMDGMTPMQKQNLEEMKLEDLKAKNYLFESLDKSILKTITQKDTSKRLWDSMKMKCQEVEDSDDGSEEENAASPARDESSDENEDDEAAPPMTPRVRRTPSYLNDFISGDGLSDEEKDVQTHLALFASVVHSDPISFDEAVKEDK
ncbi:hypothetical protein KIW84_056832 [Lathyrus oleraceus]|uniref:Retrovirus-related Pol polyprotein from transposon TNT 1-94 n=1 Tax=Pisum sativum TaxID=3888 RepID=A0A9D5ALY4_PEA|nr:hypothetical protein KIW84_056832 [Pisum sativum]